MKFNNKTELTNWALETLNLWLFLDYDGTLVDFVSSPDVITPNPKVAHVLDQLARQPQMRVTIISGRKLHDIRLLLPVTGIFLAGTYGIEMLTSSGETINRVDYDDIRPTLESLKPQWERIIVGRKGFFLEDKGWTLALHARFADDSDAEEVLAAAQLTIDQQKLTGLFRVLGGHKFLEIAPILANKKEAVDYLLRQFPFPGAKCIYIGDDDKDEEAFAAIHAQNGAAIKVSQPSQVSLSTEADYFLESPKDAIRWLENLIR
ncbi:MAG: trehalose-phosphatase [Anaerolineales bacterium]|nr:trehalose-phosphatase [Anaerolineales bacterium]